MMKGMKILSHFREKSVRIFNYFCLFISIVWTQNDDVIISSINADTVQNKLDYYLEQDHGLSISFVLKSFDKVDNISTYSIVDNPKAIDTILVKYNDKIKNNTLKQIFALYESTVIGENFNHVGKKLVSRYYFINDEPIPQLGMINSELGAIISFTPNFESNFSGILGISNLENKWNINGELDLQMENYFQNAERGSFYWKRIDSLSQIIKLGVLFPHPFGWKTGIDLKYQYGIFKGLYTSMENRHMLNTYMPWLNKVGLGYVFGRTTPTQKGMDLGHRASKYQAFSFSSNREEMNDRYLPTSGTGIQLIIDGGLDGQVNYLNTSFSFMKIKPINTNVFYKVKFSGKGIVYDGIAVPISRYHRFGGALSLRGYEEQQFTSTQFQVTTVELGYNTTNLMQMIAFMDLGSDRINVFQKSWLGYGIGLSQINKDFMINLEYGISGNSLKNGKIHLRWITRL